MKKIISILGSTGTIGINSLEIFQKKKNLFKYNIFAANKNYNLICKQIIKFKPRIFVVSDPKVFEKVKKKFKKNKTKIFSSDFFKKNLSVKSDITIAAIPGIAGLEPTVYFTKKSKNILIANKESIICGWNIINKYAKINNTKIIPIDSEHFSIMKLIEDKKKNQIKKIYLTASGGPFLNYKLSKLKNIKPSEAVKHPRWKMGKKISIDSASLMNKLLELIEAKKIFSIDEKKFKLLYTQSHLFMQLLNLKMAYINLFITKQQ